MPSAPTKKLPQKFAGVHVCNQNFLRQHVPGVDEAAVVAHFKVKMGPGGVAGAAGVADHLALADALTTVCEGVVKVSIEAVVAVAVIDHDHDAVSAADGTGVNHHAVVNCIDGGGEGGSHVNAQMAGPVVIAGEVMIVSGPNECA